MGRHSTLNRGVRWSLSPHGISFYPRTADAPYGRNPPRDESHPHGTARTAAFDFIVDPENPQRCMGTIKKEGRIGADKKIFGGNQFFIHEDTKDCYSYWHSPHGDAPIAVNGNGGADMDQVADDQGFFNPFIAAAAQNDAALVWLIPDDTGYTAQYLPKTIYKNGKELYTHPTEWIAGVWVTDTPSDGPLVLFVTTNCWVDTLRWIKPDGNIGTVGALQAQAINDRFDHTVHAHPWRPSTDGLHAASVFHSYQDTKSMVVVADITAGAGTFSATTTTTDYVLYSASYFRKNRNNASTLSADPSGCTESVLIQDTTVDDEYADTGIIDGLLPYAVAYSDVGILLTAELQIKTGGILKFYSSDSIYELMNRGNDCDAGGERHRTYSLQGHSGDIEKIDLHYNGHVTTIKNQQTGYRHTISQTENYEGLGISGNTHSSFYPYSCTGNISNKYNEEFDSPTHGSGGLFSVIRFLDLKSGTLGLVTFSTPGWNHQDISYFKSWGPQTTFQDYVDIPGVGIWNSDLGAQCDYEVLLRGSKNVRLAGERYIDTATHSSTDTPILLTTNTIDYYYGPFSIWPDTPFEGTPVQVYYNPTIDISYAGGAPGFAYDTRSDVMVWFDRFGKVPPRDTNLLTFFSTWSDPPGIDPFQYADFSDPESIMPVGMF